MLLSACAQFRPVAPDDFSRQATANVTQAANSEVPSTDTLVGAELSNSSPMSMPERYPFVRFINHPSGELTALIVAPVGFGAVMESRLKEFCECFQPGQETATLRVIAGGGTYLSGDPKAESWAGNAVMKPVEDILDLRGPESAVEEVLAFIDLFFNGGPQIEIQAEIFEITKTDSFERGVQPNGTMIQQLGDVSANGGPAFMGMGGGFAATGIGDFASGGPGGIFSLAFSDDDIKVNAFLQLLRGMEDVDIVSYPRIVTRNGVPATIDSNEEIPYLKVSSLSSATGITGLSVADKKAGVTMWVQPFLLGGDTIQMTIVVNASRIGRSFEVGTDNTGRPISIPSLNIRSATTAVTVKSGSKVVIGGLKLREDRKVESKVPVLGDIPLLGWLFSSEETVETETEVMFVLTPRVKTRAASISPFTNEIFDPFAPNPN